MNQRKIANISKTLVACSVTAGIFALSFLITIIIKSYDGISGTLSQYFLKKYASNLNAGNQRRYVLSSISVLCLAAQSILILKKTKKEDKDSKLAQSKTIKSAFLLMSLSLMCQIPTIGFYLSLFIEIDNHFDIFSIRLVVLGQGCFSFLFSLVCWGITLKGSLQHSGGQQDQKKASIQYESQFVEGIIINNREMENIISKPMLEPLFHKQNNDESNIFDPDGHCNGQKDRLGCFFDVQNSSRNEKFIGSFNYGQNTHEPKILNQNGQQYEKNRQKKLQKQRLKAQIQKKKKKFRQLNNSLINENQAYNQEASQQSDQNTSKMQNLPKSYRQYIKDAKRPRRMIRIVDSVPANFVQTKIVNLIEPPKWENSALGRRIRQSIEKNRSNHGESELVFTRSLKAKQRSTKKLFDNDSFQLRTCRQQSQDISGQITKDRLAKYRKPKTAQQELLIRLRNRYQAIENQQKTRRQ